MALFLCQLLLFKFLLPKLIFILSVRRFYKWLKEKNF